MKTWTAKNIIKSKQFHTTKTEDPPSKYDEISRQKGENVVVKQMLNYLQLVKSEQ